MTEQLETQLDAERRTDSINLSPVAASKVKSLLEQEGRDDLSLRISVQPGGCSGLRYQLFFDERSLDGDVVTDFDGVGVVVDRMSVPYLNGAMIDFVDTIEKQGFTIDNPNAGGSCACGDSLPLSRTQTHGSPRLGGGFCISGGQSVQVQVQRVGDPLRRLGDLDLPLGQVGRVVGVEVGVGQPRARRAAAGRRPRRRRRASSAGCPARSRRSRDRR